MRALLLAIAVVLAVPGLAGAAPTPGDYGGGVLVPGTGQDRAGPGTAWMWADVLSNGNVVVVAEVSVRCGTAWDVAFASHVVRPAADGSFAFTDRTRFDDGRRVERIRMTGRFEGSGAAGTIRGQLKLLRRDGSVRRRCGAPPANWQLRMRPQPGAPAPPLAAATYHGLTSQRDRVMPHPFLLRVDDAGTRVATTLFTYIRDCRRPSYHMPNFGPAVAIRPDGTFTQRERFTLLWNRNGKRERERFRLRVDGQFTAGVVHGTLRVRSVVRRNGRTVDRCDTGALTFAAAL